MSRTVLDLDDELLAKASRLLDTKTKVATVNAALAEVVNRAERMDFFDWIAGGGLPDLGDPDIRKQAWR